MMVGDLTYDVHLFERGHVPGVGSRRRLQEATAMVNKIRERIPGLVVLPAHDPGAAERLAQATGETLPAGAHPQPMTAPAKTSTHHPTFSSRDKTAVDDCPAASRNQQPARPHARPVPAPKFRLTNRGRGRPVRHPRPRPASNRRASHPPSWPGGSHHKAFVYAPWEGF